MELEPDFRLRIRSPGSNVVKQAKSLLMFESTYRASVEAFYDLPTLHCYRIRVGLGIPQITQGRP